LVDHGAGEDLIGTVGQCGDPDNGGAVLCQLVAKGVFHQVNGVGGQATVAGDADFAQSSIAEPML
jgi:hypothetical protein